MRIQRQCKICNKEFTAIKHTQWFCQRKCFKKDYYQRTKGKILEMLSRTPLYGCPVCQCKYALGFDPIRNETAFNDHICPFCGIPRAITHQFASREDFVMGNSRTAQYVVSSAIISSVELSITIG